ncbi:hypothetical protein [Actinacidiphila rubida]|uniref:Uncharacterized protein n=1 Tax=Actinacidiphila rubida TaxID=310780 RepID=A0A1H8SYB4_9ACTN|nr:hypothetical protein [Actinacidiphila rubida]SEO83328.1 hypothetical protein SAMN05216267_104638 [Actinacidiphila rubida]
MNDDTPAWDYPDIPPPPPRLPRARDGHQQFTSPRNQRDRDVWAAERWVQNGWTHQQIADALGLSAKSSAHEAVERGLRAPAAEREQRASDNRELLRARLELLHTTALDVMARKHLTVSFGKVITIKDDDGNEVPLIDDGPVLQAIDRLLKINESQRKFDGLDAPTQVSLGGEVTYNLVGVDPDDLS